MWPDLCDEGGVGLRGEVRDVVRGGLSRIRIRKEMRPGAQRNVPPSADQSRKTGEFEFIENTILTSFTCLAP